MGLGGCLRKHGVRAPSIRNIVREEQTYCDHVFRTLLICQDGAEWKCKNLHILHGGGTFRQVVNPAYGHL